MNLSARAQEVGSLPPGAHIADRFELVELIGVGGVGSVYRALEIETGRAVAIKLLHSESGEARFAREAAVLASLRHPGIVRCIEYGLAENHRPFLVMEWLAGEDLDARLRREPLALNEVLTLARRVAEALAEAHRRGVIHRDLKPANLFLVEGRVEDVKIVDFGLALPATHEDLTAPGVLLGTPSYMAPEQVRSDRVDARVDVYSLGAVLFRCLAGVAPFRGENQLAVLAKVLLEEAPNLGAAFPELPAEVCALVARLLAKEPARRPADGAALLEALDELRPSHTPGALPAVSASEQRVVCVVLSATAARGDHVPQPPDDRQEITLPLELASSAEAAIMAGRLTSGRHDALREVVKATGGTLYVLADGTRMVAARGATPVEQAVVAARCALAIAALRPRGVHVVAMGRVVVARDVQVGEVIDRAAGALVSLRAQGSAVAGVRLDADTASLLDDRFEVRGDGEWRELVGVHEGAVSVRTVLGRVTPCRGRARELASLSASLEDSFGEPRARAVLVIAPPGMGKSRVLHEFLRTTVAQRVEAEALCARGDATRAGSPFAIASQLVCGAAGVADDASSATRAARIRATFEEDIDAERARGMGDFLCDVCGVPPARDAASAAFRAARDDGAVMADGLREAWTEWLRVRCARRPTLLVIEDLHWGDLPSLQLIDAALEALAERPLLVVATARPEARASFPELWRGRTLDEINLGPLARRAAEQLTREALGDDANDDLVRALVDRAAGHPFHLEELVRAAAAGREPGVLPDSVLGMVQARMDLLDGDARRMLRAASVFGENFWVGGVTALLGDHADAPAAAGRLGELVAREMIVRRGSSRFVGEPEYAFRHALVRDAAYAMLPERERASAHRLAGQWLEARGEGDPAVLAEHFERGGAMTRAASFLRRAAELALDGNDLARATLCAERALACGPDETSRGPLRAIQSEVAFWRGDLDEASRAASEAAELLEFASPAWFDAVAVAISALGQRGQNKLVAAWLERAASASSSPEARGAHLTAICRGLTQLYWAHHGDDLRDVHTRLYALAQPFETLEPYHAGWVHRVRAEGLWLRAHDLDGCLAALDASCDAYERARARRPLCLTWINSASLHGWSGEPARAEELLSLASAEAGRLRAGFLSRYALAVRGLTKLWVGAEGAEEALREALPSFTSSPRVAFIVRVFIGYAALERGEVPVAEEHCTAAMGLPVVANLKPAGMALLARVLMAKKAVSQAVEVAREAVRLDRESRDIELTYGIADLALAEALEARHDHAAAVTALTEGYRRLDAIAAQIASTERRERFWSRRLPNARVRELARAWGVAGTVC